MSSSQLTIQNPIVLGITGQKAVISAYDIAVKNGFVGAESEWLQTLKFIQSPITGEVLAAAQAAAASAFASGASEQVATQKAAQTVEDAASALASKQEAEIAAIASGGFASDSGISATASNAAKLLSEAAKVIAIEEAGKSSTSAGQSSASATDAEAAKNIVLANIIDPATQIEVSGNVTALEAWRNKVIIVTNDSTITIPASLFTNNWTFRVLVRNGVLQIAKLGAKTFPFVNPEPLISAKSDFSIRQRGLTQEVLITGKIISTPFEASFQTQNILAGGSNEFQVRLPFSSTSFQPVIVDWGNGDIESIATFNAENTTKTYESAGDYRIKIYGNSFFMPFNDGLEKLKITEVFSWGGVVIGSGSFYGCANLTAIDVKDVPYNISENLFNAFRSCVNLTKVRGMNEWNVGSVTNMQQTFMSAVLFNQNIGSWNTQNVTNMIATFFNATSFNQNIGAWNVANVANMSQMFYMATSFNQNIGLWNVGKVVNMSNMFVLAKAFNQNIGAWDTEKVINMQSMFHDATAFNQDLGSWNIGNVTNFLNFMQNKTFANFSSANYNALLIGWASRPVKPNIFINFGTIKYTSAATEARAVLTSSPNFWTIIDGGI
jgi:surface protein